MSSDLFAFEAPFSTHSSSANGDIPFFSDPHYFLLDEEIPSSLDPFSPSFSSFYPPSTQLQNLSLHPLPNSETEYGNPSVLEVKSEECKAKAAVDYSYNHHLVPQSYTYGAIDSENVSKLMMQRSFSSKSFDGRPGYLFQPPHYETAGFQTQALSSPDNTLFTPHMRRVFSTGDLQVSLYFISYYLSRPLFFLS